MSQPPDRPPPGPDDETVVQGPAEPTEPTEPSPGPARRWPPPNLGRWLLALLAVVLIGIGAVVLLTDDDEESSPTTTAQTEPETQTTTESVTETETVTTTEQTTTTETSTTPAPGSPTTVPSVEGQDLTDAVQTLADSGLRAGIEYVPSDQPRNRVFGQALPSGTQAQRGDSVGLSVSRGPSPPVEVVVPDVIGQTREQASQALEQVLLEVLVIDVPAVTMDQVVAHSPPAGVRIPRGSLVVVYAGKTG